MKTLFILCTLILSVRAFAGEPVSNKSSPFIVGGSMNASGGAAKNTIDGNMITGVSVYDYSRIGDKRVKFSGLNADCTAKFENIDTKEVWSHLTADDAYAQGMPMGEMSRFYGSRPECGYKAPALSVNGQAVFATALNVWTCTASFIGAGSGRLQDVTMDEAIKAGMPADQAKKFYTHWKCPGATPAKQEDPRLARIRASAVRSPSSLTAPSNTLAAPKSPSKFVVGAGSAN